MTVWRIPPTPHDADVEKLSRNNTGQQEIEALTQLNQKVAACVRAADDTISLLTPTKEATDTLQNLKLVARRIIHLEDDVSNFLQLKPELEGLEQESREIRAQCAELQQQLQQVQTLIADIQLYDQLREDNLAILDKMS